MLGYETEELMDQVEEFKTFVYELRDYSWRLTEKETHTRMVFWNWH
jgi:hypothetical protein